MDSGSILSVLRRYYQYAATVLARSQQLTATTLTTESVTLVELTFCIYLEFHEFAVDLGFIEVVKYYENLTNVQV